MALRQDCEPRAADRPREGMEAPAPGRPVRVLIVFNTPFLYGMERAVIETFDLLRPEVEPLFLMTHYAYRNDLPVYREVKDSVTSLSGTWMARMGGVNECGIQVRPMA